MNDYPQRYQARCRRNLNAVDKPYRKGPNSGGARLPGRNSIAAGRVCFTYNNLCFYSRLALNHIAGHVQRSRLHWTGIGIGVVFYYLIAVLATLGVASFTGASYPEGCSQNLQD
jgi:hypothetical protein